MRSSAPWRFAWSGRVRRAAQALPIAGARRASRRSATLRPGATESGQGALDLRAGITVQGVVVHEPHRLHEGVGGRRAEEPEAPLLSALAIAREASVLVTARRFSSSSALRRSVSSGSKLQKKAARDRTPSGAPAHVGRSRGLPRPCPGDERCRRRGAGVRRFAGSSGRSDRSRNRRRPSGNSPACAGSSARRAPIEILRDRVFRRGAGRRRPGSPTRCRDRPGSRRGLRTRRIAGARLRVVTPPPRTSGPGTRGGASRGRPARPRRSPRFRSSPRSRGGPLPAGARIRGARGPGKRPSTHGA